MGKILNFTMNFSLHLPSMVGKRINNLLMFWVSAKANTMRKPMKTKTKIAWNWMDNFHSDDSFTIPAKPKKASAI